MDQEPILKDVYNTDYRFLIGDVFFKTIWENFENSIIDEDGNLLKKPTVNPISYKSYFEQEKEIWKTHDSEILEKGFDLLEIKVKYKLEKHKIENLKETELIILSSDFEKQLNAYHEEYEVIDKSMLSSFKSLYEKLALDTKYYSRKGTPPTDGEKFMGEMLLRHIYSEMQNAKSMDEFDVVFSGDNLEWFRTFMEDQNYSIDRDVYTYTSLRKDVSKRLDFIDRYIGLKAKYYQIRQIIAARLNLAEPHHHPIDILKKKIVNHVDNMDLNDDKRQLVKEFLFDVAEHEYSNNKASFRAWFLNSKYDPGIPERSAYEYHKILLNLK